MKARVAALDWAGIAASLDATGAATTGPLLTADECAALAGGYDRPDGFRSRVTHGRRHTLGIIFYDAA